MSRYLLMAFFFGLLASVSHADKPEVYTHKKHGAIMGYDPVAFFSLPSGAKAIKGDKDISAEWNGARWHFASEENKARFLAEPDKYSPQYGGYCAFAVAHGFVTSPRPNNWTVFEGKLYLNNNYSSLKLWRDDRDRKIAIADKNWPDVLKR